MNSVTQARAECILLLKCSQPTLSESSPHRSVPHTVPLNCETLSMGGDPFATLCCRIHSYSLSMKLTSLFSKKHWFFVIQFKCRLQVCHPYYPRWTLFLPFQCPLNFCIHSFENFSHFLCLHAEG